MEEIVMSSGDNGGVLNRYPRRTLSTKLLPNEIFPFIFVNLSADECKNVRLTCRSWYAHSFERIVTKNQKFVFTGSDSIAEICKFLLASTSNRRLLNLEFRDLPINSPLLSVWEKCNHQVHSLKFHDCSFGYTALAKVVEHCMDLTSLIIIEQYMSEFDYLGGDSLLMLLHSIQEGLRRPMLRTFLWLYGSNRSFHWGTYPSNNTMEHILTAFPCLTYVGKGRTSSCDYQNCWYDENYQLHCSNFDECLNPSMPLKRIVYNEATDGSWMKRSILKPEWSSRLIELETMLSYETLPDYGQDILFSLFAAQKTLQVITLSALYGDEVFAKALITCIFQNCPNLRELQLTFHVSLVDPESRISLAFPTYPEFAVFFSSLAKLNCLVVNFDVELDFPSEMLVLLGCTNVALERLDLNQREKSRPFTCLVLKCCSKLKHLRLCSFSDDILQEIFKKTDLESLSLSTELYYNPEYGVLTNYGFTGRSGTGDEQLGFSIKRLQKLERLQIFIWDNDYDLEEHNRDYRRRLEVTTEIFRELQFPRLKSLDLRMESVPLENAAEEVSVDMHDLPHSESYCNFESPHYFPGDILLGLPSSFPALEELTIAPKPDDFAIVSKICEQLKHLSYLKCHLETNGLDANCLFAACPRLKVMEHAYDQQFRRCPLTNEIVLTTMNGPLPFVHSRNYWDNIRFH